MLSVAQVLTRLNISSNSRCAAIQDVRHHIESSADPIGAARVIIGNLSDGDFTTDDPIVARMTAQRLVDEALILGDGYDADKALAKAAAKVIEAREKTPWVFAKPTFSTVETTTETREGVSVEIKKDGSFKKGGKQVVAQALYLKHKALDNQAIIQIFMKELDMSKSGATTYFYNAKKAAK